MRKRILSVILIVGIIASLVACGSDGAGKKKGISETETVSAEPVVNDVKKSEEIEEVAEPALADNGGTEISNDTEDYEEQKDIFIVKHIDTGDGTEIDFTNQEIINGPFTLGDSVDIYSFYFTYAGYTKPNIKIEDVWKINEWIVVPFAESSFLVKEEDFNRVATLKDKTNNNVGEEVSSEKEEVPEVAQSSDVDASKETTPAPTPTPQEEAPAPAVTTYTEAEVISIVEDTLRNAGFRKPEELVPADILAEFGSTDGMGWGIEDISMTDPYGDAAGTLEGLQFIGHNVYYIESQGSSNGYVHLKLYSGTN